MLRKTFLHVPGIGQQTEKHLWEQGCNDWETFLSRPDDFKLGTASLELAKSEIAASIEHLERGEHQFFRSRLGLAEAWRAWPEFREKCCYLDIETDGGQSGESITTIGMYDGKEFRCLVQGDNLAEFPDLISHYSMIVTFFGSGFDLPLLQRKFPYVKFDQIHLDLCPTLKRIGYRGGLKKIEKVLGIARDEDTDGLSGLDAIRLWREYQRGAQASLDTLIAYNREDVVNLERLAQIAYDQLTEYIVDGVLPNLPPEAMRSSRPSYR